jgi:nicotinate-nucleotide--dimethylbenzimidazole phosphoribosyltransferase
MVGAFVVAPSHGVVTVVDGFVSGVAGLCAARMNSTCRANMVFATRLPVVLAEALGARTVLDANLSHGEGYAAVLALPLLRAAAALPGAATLGEAVAL